MINGILPIDKPSGMSSYDVIRNIKKKILHKYPNLKIGHGGTLDPLATGVLPVLFGNATKIFGIINHLNKNYIAEIKLGAFTDTDDSTGDIIEEFNVNIDIENILEVLNKYKGKISQIPPLYSAIKINGERSYKLARQNFLVNIKPRKVEIKEIEFISYNIEKFILCISIICSSGTYIRSIARDIGRELNCGGYILSLMRTETCGINLEDCVELEDITSDNIEKFVFDINKVLKFIPEVHSKVDYNFFYTGKRLKYQYFEENLINDGLYRVVKDEKLLAIIRKNNKSLEYVRVFN